MIERTPDGLAAIGRLLHGEDWQSPLARDLGVNRESIRRWLNGSQPLPPEHGIWDDVIIIVRAQADESRRQAATLSAVADRIASDI